MLLLPLLIAACFLNAQTTILDSIWSGGQYRYYTLYVPAAYDGSEAVPVVYNLHGYSSSAFQQIFYGEFRPIADTANFLIILPDGTTDFIGFQFWNTFAPFGTGVDDVAFLSDLLDTVIAAYNVDEQRIYSTGMSNGGFMSYELACQLSNRITAIASVTGSIDVDHFDFCSPEHLTPVMEIHGTNDMTVPYDGNAEFLPIQDILDYWVAFNGCDPTPVITPIEDIAPGDGSTAEHWIYSGAANGVTVEHFRIINGGHTWPGTIFLLPSSGSTNKDINASAEIWKFFSRYSLDQVTGISAEPAVTQPIRVYPNPAKDHIQMELPLAAMAFPVSIRDYAGREVMRFITGNPIETIDVSGLSSGVYFIVTEFGTSRFALIP